MKKSEGNIAPVKVKKDVSVPQNDDKKNKDERFEKMVEAALEGKQYYE